MTPEQVIGLMGDRDFVQIQQHKDSSYEITIMEHSTIGRVSVRYTRDTVQECFAKLAEIVAGRDVASPDEIVQLMQNPQIRGITFNPSREVNIVYADGGQNVSTGYDTPERSFGMFKRVVWCPSPHKSVK